MTIDDLCQELNNWFDENALDGTKKRYFGSFTISEEALDLSGFGIQDGQYYRIIGSVFNDGVHKYGDKGDTLTDETFEGAVWLMSIPAAVTSLLAEIEAWNEKYGGVDSAAASPFQSESFGGYSYSKSSGSSVSGSADTGSWQAQFASRLNRWRKIR